MNNFLSRYWFPASLIGLLLLAVPGLVLFALNLFGYEKPVNDFLERTFQLTYHLPLPWWAILLLLAVPFAIVLLYFLKLKRKPLAVPSTFLWRKSIEDLHVNSLFQWLRENVLLLLQVLAVLALIYGVMAFHLHGKTSGGKHYILMIDNSASMAAADVAPNRLEWAKQEALKEIDAATDNDFGMIIEFNSSASIKQSYTANRALLRQAVKDIAQTQRPTQLEEALSLADSLANPRRSTDDAAVRPANEDPSKARTYLPAEGIPTEVHLFSDGRFPDVPDFTTGNLNVRYHAAGNLVLDTTPRPGAKSNEPVLRPGPDSADNVALVTFNAVRDEKDPTLYQVLVRAMNYRDRSAVLKVRLEVLVNGAVKNIYDQPLKLDARRVTEEKEAGKDEPVLIDLPGEGTATFEISEIDERAQVELHAKLAGEQAGTTWKDMLPLDDEAWLVLGVIRKARVLIVGPPNEILSAFFDDDATRAVADVRTLPPADLTKDAYLEAARNGTYDLVIFDRCAPAQEQELPRGNTFFIGAPPPPWKLPGAEAGPGAKTVEKLENPYITGWKTNAPVLRYLSTLHDVGLSEAFKFKPEDLPANAPLIETGGNGAVLVSLSRGPFTDLVLTFPLLNDKGEWTTNWPLLTSFPLFLRNVLYSLGNVSDAATEETVQPGQVKTLRPDAGVRKGVVRDPAGREKVLEHDEREARKDFSYGDTDRVGVYRVTWADGVKRNFAVNLLDTDESHIEPRPAVQIGTEQYTAGKERSQPREVWRWFALVALCVLLVEWYIYNRRVYI